MTVRINIIYSNNGVGLSRDAIILANALSNYDVKLVDANKMSFNKVDVNLILETLNFNSYNIKKLKNYAKLNYLIPNQEWFFKEWIPDLQFIDKVLCKTKDAVNIFSSLGCNCEYISFTSDDRYMKTEKCLEFFHGAGQSNTKGTDSIVNTWNCMSKKPKLTVCKYNRIYPQSYGITFFNNRIDDIVFKEMQNKYVFHLCPSSCEGFGHYINEAKSCGNIVLTLDAPPMNELVTNEFGVLAKYDSISTHHLAKSYSISTKLLCEGIETLINLNSNTIKRMMKTSRESFLSNDKFFKEKINNIFKDVETI